MEKEKAEECEKGMNVAYEQVYKRSAMRLADLLDKILPYARQAFGENDVLPDEFAEAEELILGLSGEEAVLAGEADIEIEDNELAEPEVVIDLDSLEGSLFAAAEATRRINAHKIVGLSIPDGALSEQKEILAVLAAHLGQKPDTFWAKLKALFS